MTMAWIELETALPTPLDGPTPSFLSSSLPRFRARSLSQSLVELFPTLSQGPAKIGDFPPHFHPYMAVRGTTPTHVVGAAPWSSRSPLGCSGPTPQGLLSNYCINPDFHLPDEVVAYVLCIKLISERWYSLIDMIDWLAIEASFLQKEEGLLSHWKKENAECKDGLKGQTSSNTGGDLQQNSQTDKLYAAHKERVGVKGRLYEVLIFFGFMVYMNMVNSDYLPFFNARRPVDKKIHNYKNFTRLSKHGVVCVSAVGGKIQIVDFHGIFEGKIHEAVPSAQIFTYACACDGCGRTCDMLERAFDKAINDNIDIISMSLGVGRVAYLKVKDDDIGRKTLKAFKSNILTCLPAGNKVLLTITHTDIPLALSGGIRMADQDRVAQDRIVELVKVKKRKPLIEIVECSFVK
ncbi:hypothetical protein Cgig2_010276 [Carnegiea gigantea]|uniref:Peptidase S8/S53 domain-containing protein n=1 Tax=Carnegiea gigantea TaxID=171969 RepID=A0A9Q1JR73_9CARY|nr:hypothetical protein Cgig2_010276 [Carnegiea gigantea]